MMKLRKIQTSKDGFTLVEIAIVMVIIGLLIGGVLKGQAMIQNAKVKRFVKDFDSLRAAVYTYQDKYGMLPGDESSATTPSGDANNGDNDGLFDETDGWEMQDLRLAGILPGTGIGLPSHAFGGTIRVDYINIGGLNSNKIYAVNVPSDVCQEIDIKYDDGVWNTGDIRGNADYTTATNRNLGWNL